MFEPTAIYAPNPHRYDTMTYNLSLIHISEPTRRS